MYLIQNCRTRRGQGTNVAKSDIDETRSKTSASSLALRMSPTPESITESISHISVHDKPTIDKESSTKTTSENAAIEVRNETYFTPKLKYKPFKSIEILSNVQS